MTEYFSRIDKAERIRCRPEDEGSFLLYNPRTDQLHLVPVAGKRIFDLCDGRSIDEVVQDGCAVLAETGEVQEPARVLGFLCELERRDLVVMS